MSKVTHYGLETIGVQVLTTDVLVEGNTKPLLEITIEYAGKSMYLLFEKQEAVKLANDLHLKCREL